MKNLQGVVVGAPIFEYIPIEHCFGGPAEKAEVGQTKAEFVNNLQGGRNHLIRLLGAGGDV